MTTYRALLPLVLLAGLVSPPAFAQTMVGGQTVSDHDLPYVQSRCATLARKQNTRAGAMSEPYLAPGEELDPDSAFSDAPDEMDEALTRVNLAGISLRDCRDAGMQ